MAYGTDERGNHGSPFHWQKWSSILKIKVRTQKEGYKERRGEERSGEVR